MPEAAWKRLEKRIARLFGAERNSLSGQDGKLSRSDSTHPVLFIEAKQRQKHAAWALYEDTKARAVAENKVPLVVLHQVRKQGALLCIHIDDFPDVIGEYCRAQGISVIYDAEHDVVSITQVLVDDDGEDV